MRHYLFLIFFVLSNGVSFAQQYRTSKSVKFNSVEEFVSNQDAVHNERVKFHTSTDPNVRFPLAMHQLLWDKNIKFSLPFKHIDGQSKAGVIGEGIKIDAFGLSTTAFMREKLPELATDFMKEINDEVVGKSIDFDGLYEIVLKLKEELDVAWAGLNEKEFDALVMRASLLNHFSKVRNKHENVGC